MRPLLSFLLAVLVGSGGATYSAAQETSAKDTTAMAVLTQMATATGWSKFTAPGDVLATGTVTRYQGDTTDTVAITLKSKGFLLYRTEIQEVGATTTTIVNGDRAAVLKSSGNEFLPSHAALAMRPLVFPFFSDLAATTDTSVSVRYLGTETVAGQATQRIEISREPATDDPFGELRRRAGRLTVWVSTSTYLPIMIEYTRVADNNPTALRTRVRSFSDYRVVGGLAVPFRQQDSDGGQLLYTLQLTQVQFNVGLSDSEFTLPAAQQ